MYSSLVDNNQQSLFPQQTALPSELPVNDSSNQTTTSSRNDLTLKILKKKLDYILTLFTGENLENDTATNNRLKLIEDLRSVPLTLRILGGQV